MTNLRLENTLDHNLKPLKAEDKILPLNVSESKVVYPKTPTDTYELANKKYVDDNAGGGGSSTFYWMPQFSGRFQTRYDNWYHPSNAYGGYFYLWGHTVGSSSLPSVWADNKNPSIVVPKDCTINSYHMRGYTNSSQTYELALLKGTPTYGSTGDTSLSQVGSTQSLAATANIQNKIEETGLSVSLSAGDIIIPSLRRTPTDPSASYYWYMVFNLIAEV